MKRIKVLLLGLSILLIASYAMAIEFGSDTFGSVEVHGFASQGYLFSDNNNFFAKTSDGTTRFNEFAINASSEVNDRLRVGLQIFARNLGEFGGGEPEIDWAFADYRWQDWLGIRFGKMKFAHGLYNATRDVDMLRTSIFLPQSVYNEAWRDSLAGISGGELYGDLYLAKAGTLSYQIQIGELGFPKDGGVIATTSDQARLLGMVANVDSTHTKYSYAGSLVWSTPIDGLRLGVTGFMLDFDADGTFESTIRAGALANVRTNVTDKVYTASIEYIYGPFTFAAEYMTSKYEFSTKAKSGNDVDFVNAINRVPTIDLDTEGYYGLLAYRFTDWFELGLSYSEYYADKNDRKGDNNKTDPVRIAAGYQDHDAWLKDLALTTRFDITNNWVFKLEGHAMNGAAVLMKDINMNDQGLLDTSENWFLLAAKMTVSF